jgi:hypothetical protein
MVLLLAAAAGPARAQETPRAKPPAEVGVGWERLAPIRFDFVTDDLTEASIELRASVPLTPRFALEGLVTIGRRDTGFARRTEGVHIAQIRQRLIRAERGRLRPFLTYGVAGYHAHVSERPIVTQNPDGTTTTRPAQSYRELDAVVSMALGGGIQYEISRHLALRADVQYLGVLWIPAGLRYSVGLSIPIGAYRD